MNRAVLLVVLVSILVCLPGSGAEAAAAPAARFGDSSSSGGYVITPRSMTSVSSSWVVPTVRCSTPNAAVSFAVGLLDRVHGGFTRLGVDVDCHAGKPTYGPYIRLPGGTRATLHTPVRPGDSIRAELDVSHGHISGIMSGAGWVTLIRTDGMLHPTSAGILVTELGTPSGRTRPLADFGAVHFSHSRLNRQPVAGHAERLTMRQADGERMVTVSPLTRPKGSFSVSVLGS